MQQLNYEKTKKLLEKYKLPTAKSELTKNVEQAKTAAKKLSYPVVLKLISKDVLHKSDAGGIIKDIKDQEQLIDSYAKLSKKKHDAIMIQKQETGTEVIIGMKRDPHFDSTIMFGLLWDRNVLNCNNRERYLISNLSKLSIQGGRRKKDQA